EGRSITSQSYLREVRKACSCAVSAIDYQLATGRSWSDSEYIRGSLEVMLSQFDRFPTYTNDEIDLAHGGATA
ncbi:UNVERIFIED_CONTAM: hypothetical protein RF648_21530, partial [Kocuria sp. CPCC 205274]